MTGHRRSAARRADRAADLGRAGEHERLRPGMADEGGADCSPALHDADEARRRAGAPEELLDPGAGERRQLGRLDHDRVAGGDGGRDLRQRHAEREVPGRDDRHDSDRLVPQPRSLVHEVGLPHRQALRSQHASRVAGEPRQRHRGRRTARMVYASTSGLPVSATIEPRDHRPRRQHLVRDPPQQPATLLERAPGPAPPARDGLREDLAQASGGVDRTVPTRSRVAGLTGTSTSAGAAGRSRSWGHGRRRSQSVGAQRPLAERDAHGRGARCRCAG